MSPRMNILLILTAVSVVNSVECEKPNIVIILADDLVNLLFFPFNSCGAYF